jgi:hypothetical protein
VSMYMRWRIWTTPSRGMVCDNAMNAYEQATTITEFAVTYALGDDRLHGRQLVSVFVTQPPYDHGVPGCSWQRNSWSGSTKRSCGLRPEYLGKSGEGIVSLRALKARVAVCGWQLYAAVGNETSRRSLRDRRQRSHPMLLGGLFGRR